MITQCWIGKNFLSGILHRPDIRINNTAVVLMSGFSQSMCDLDYFMSKLARRLASIGFYVLQVDPRGHGDSPGTLEKIALDSMREDIADTVNYLRRESDFNIIFIGRGLIATIAAELADKLHLSGIAGINPYCFDPKEVSLIYKDIKPGLYEFADIYPGRYYSTLADFDPLKAGFFCSLGACPSNLHGQLISSDFLFSISEYDPFAALSSCETDSLWLFYHETDKDNILEWRPSVKNRYIRGYLPRNPFWQHNVIEKLCKWISKKNRLRRYA